MMYLLFSAIVEEPVSTDLLYIDAAAILGAALTCVFVKWDARRLNRKYGDR